MSKLLKIFDVAIYYPVFKVVQIIGCIPARLKLIRSTKLLMRLNAKLVLIMRQGKRKHDIEEIGKEWKRMFPLKQMQKITTVTEDTVYAETHTLCPLRGTGDVQACYRMMEFDRCMLETIGGQFVVLRSQAEPGVKVCEIAIRKLGKSTKDLIHAHEHY